MEWHHTFSKVLLGHTYWKVHGSASYDYQTCVSSNGPNFVKSREVHGGCTVISGGSHLDGMAMRFYMWDRRGHNRHPFIFLFDCGKNKLHESDKKPMTATPFLHYSKLRRPPKGRVYIVVYPIKEADIEWMSPAVALR